ncbi:cleavage stimulation factor subunit 3-like [Artemia franciscana]|uniref:cleavage stimulation factor subunit 3-like n=1 Tax=Artemia franciscana TaxID=6661 RepID=UPI0032D9E68F
MTEKLNRAYRSLDDNPYNLDAWNQLIRDACLSKIDEARPIFEKLIATFPTCGRYWKTYIEQEMKARNFDKVEKLFQRSLLKVLNIDLWKCYVNYVKDTKASTPNYKERMAQAYDFALDKMGMDMHAQSLWMDYITFLKGVEAVGSFAENQRIAAVRKVFQRAIVTPIIGVEVLWKEYVSFEQSINTLIAEKMTMERAKDHMNARRVAKELEALTRGLNRHSPSLPPSGTAEEAKQVDLWKKYLSWEKANPLGTEDKILLTRRVMFAYEQCLLVLSHHPDIWYEATLFLEQSAKIMNEKGDVTSSKLFSNEVANMFERCTGGILKNCSLLHFAYADFEESRLQYEKVHQIYQKLIDIRDVDPTLAYIQQMKFARRAEGIKSARAVFKKAREDQRSSYNVFVAAALMEYYCSKDKNVAFKIFELGLKKYSDDPEYLVAYVDYLSHLNEDNNTRVLFERILSSPSLSSQKSIEIWNRFLEFEANIGDLSSIVKVEKRRAQVLEQLQEYEGRETAYLVDRYKFANLYPCSDEELRVIRYPEVSKGLSISFGVRRMNTLGLGLNKKAIINDGYPKPDLNQLVPFKPVREWKPNHGTIPGGAFPYPAAVQQTLLLLPPPDSFHGPFAIVDKLMDTIMNMTISEEYKPGREEEGVSTKLFDLAKSVHWVEENGKEEKTKRKKVAKTRNDSEEEEEGHKIPSYDIFRIRQQKKVKKL